MEVQTLGDRVDVRGFFGIELFQGLALHAAGMGSVQQARRNRSQTKPAIERLKGFGTFGSEEKATRAEGGCR